MKKYIGQNKKNITCLALCLCLSAVMTCPKAFADGEFFYIEPVQVPSIKLKNPIYLDKTKVEKFTSNTSIPFNLRGQFDEADYFSSSAHEIPPAEPPPELDFAKIPSPSEYKKVNSIAKEATEQPAVFTPTEDANKFFAPLENIQEDSLAVEKGGKYNLGEDIPTGKTVEKGGKYNLGEDIPAGKTSEKILPELKNIPTNSYKENIYTASANIEEADADIEGKKITKIEIKGLRTLSDSVVLDKISTQEGSLFRTETIQKDLQNIYSLGYFSDEMSVEPILNPDDTVELTFTIKENLLIEKVLIVGNDIIRTEELSPFVIEMQGKPQNLKNINSAIENIHNYYHEKGYVLANVHSVDDDKDGNLSFTIWEGIINKIDISGNERTKDYVITRNIMTQPGTVYNEECLKKDLTKVFSTQIFDEVDRDIKPNEENIGTYDVTVVVKEKTTNSIGFGGGIDSGMGAFGSISLREENFLGKAQKLSLSGIIGSGILLNDASIKNHMNYQAELSFFEPYFINADNSLMAKLYFREMGSWNVPLAIEQRIGFKTGVEHKVKDYENLTTSFTAGIEHIDLKEGDYNKISQLFARHNMNISERAKQLTGGFFINLIPGIRYSNLDNDEVPRQGIVAQAQFNEAIGVSDFNHTNGRLSGAVTKFFPVFKKSSFSLTGKAGIKVHGDDMPEIMAYRLGGPYSIRGFRMNGVGAGDSFLMGSAELATPLPWSDRLRWDFIKKMRLTFFVDAGKVFDPISTNILYDRPLHAITAGVGLRMYIPGIGPMSVDYGLPLINPGDYGSEHGYFTFGSGGINGYGYMY